MKLTSSLFLIALSVVAAPSLAQPVVNLRCEYKIAPQGIDVFRPRLTWRWQPGSAWRQQAAYELLVATSPEKLAQGVGDLWATKKVESAWPGAVYGGRALLSHQRCYWKLRVWEGQSIASPWSETASWTMGLLDYKDQTEWTGQWIGCDKAEPITIDGKAPPSPVSVKDAKWIYTPEGSNSLAPEGVRYFRRDFELPEGAKIKSASLHVGGDNKFGASVNDKKVITGEDWHATLPSDVKKLLVPGKNRISVWVNNIYPDPAKPTPGSQGPAGLMAALDVTLEDGTRISLQSDGKWLCSKDEKAPDDDWEPAKVLGGNGVAPWGKVRAGGVAEYLPATYLRRQFEAPRPVARAVIYATAHGIYELRLNGQRVGDEYFAPGFTNYKKRALYRAYDVTGLIKPGANAIGAILGDGWYRGNVSNLGQNHYGSKTRLLAQLYLFYADGRRDVITTDDQWRAAFGPILEGDLQAGETYDARREMPGWDEANFNDAKWFKPDNVVSSAERTELVSAHPGPPVRRIAEIKPVAIAEPKPGLFVVNFGQNFAGWTRLKVSEKAGTPVVLRFGEMLNADGTVYRENLRSARATDTYVCKGKGIETWEPRLTYHGFQYVEVAGLTQKPTAETLTGIVAHSDNATTGAFECSNPLINKIWSNAMWGQKSNYFEVPTNCPQRDQRLGWTGDTQVFVRTGAYNQDVAAFFTKWLNDLDDEQSAEGAFPNMAPSLHGGWSPGWADAGVIVPHTLFRVYGDARLIGQHYDAMAKHVAYYQSRAPGFLIPNEGFGDWLAIGSDTPKILIYTAYMARSTQLLAEMAEVVGKRAEAAQHRQLFEDARKAFQAKFVAPDGKVGSGSQTSYLLALRFDLLTPPQRAKAAELLVKDIEAHDGHLTTGFLGVNLLLPTLTDIGRSDVAYRLMQKTTYPSWGYSVEQGATTMWERWNSYTKDKGFGPVEMNSFNHYAYGACGEWLYRTVLGIDALEPGFSKIIVKPEPGPGVTWAKGSYDSIRGPIRSAWKIEGGALKLDVAIPPTTTAEIHVPAANAAAVTVGGRPAAQTSGLKLLRAEQGRAVFSAEPGAYAFTAAGYAAP